MRGEIRNSTLYTERCEIRLAEPSRIPDTRFFGRERELTLCQAAWDIDHDGDRFLAHSNGPPLNFRLVGPPGSGKNEIIYETARRLRRNLYIMQGHEELTPEDLVLLIAPEPGRSPSRAMPLVLRASPLATALITGGLFFFDEINRVPHRALSPLSSVLDDRRALYSAVSGIWLDALEDDGAGETPRPKNTFRFCCAMNPRAGDLPVYLEERTLPLIEIDHPPAAMMQQIVKERLNPSDPLLDAFARWLTREKKRLSTRQTLSLLTYAMKLEIVGYAAADAIAQAGQGLTGEDDEA